MEKLRNLRETAARALAQLSPRERLLVGAMVGVAALLLLLGAWGSLSSSIARRERAIQEKQDRFREVSVLAQGYSENERARRELEGKLAGPPLRLLTHLQELTDRHGLVIGSMNDRGETATGPVVESLVELQVASTTIEKLAPMLGDIEKNARIVKLRKLRLRRAAAGEKNLNVTLTVATYSLAKKGG